MNILMPVLKIVLAAIISLSATVLDFQWSGGSLAIDTNRTLSLLDVSESVIALKHDISLPFEMMERRMVQGALNELRITNYELGKVAGESKENYELSQSAIRNPQSEIMKVIHEVNNYTVKAALTEQELVGLVSASETLKSMLKGEKGDRGDSGLSIGFTSPTSTNPGSYGGTTFNSAKDFSSETLNISGSATLKSLTVSGSGSFNSLSVSGIDVVTLTGTQTLTNKTLTSPILTGNVGIGTTSPDRSLHVYGTGTTNYFRVEATGADSFAATEYKNDALTWTVGVGSDDRLHFANGPGFGTFSTSSIMVLSTLGNVGINDSSPSYDLEIHDLGDDGETALMIQGGEGSEGRLLINADDGDDPGDQWTINVETDGDLAFRDWSASAWTDNLIINNSGSVVLPNAGPHSIGGSTDPNIQVRIMGTFSAATGLANALDIQSTLNGVANNSIAGALFEPTLVEAGSGTHPRLATLDLRAPVVTAGAGTVTDATTLYISAAPSATVTGGNYAVWVDGGDSRFDGNVVLSDNGGALNYIRTNTSDGADNQKIWILSSGSCTGGACHNRGAFITLYGLESDAPGLLGLNIGNHANGILAVYKGDGAEALSIKGTDGSATFTSTAQAMVTMNSTHASGGYITLQSSAAARGYIGTNHPNDMGAGNDDFQIASAQETGSLYLQSSSGAGGTGIVFGTAGAKNMKIQTGGGVMIYLTNEPTGGSKGAGTLNVSGDIYKNGTAYTNPDYVFEKYFTGDIVKFASNPGASTYPGLKSLEEIKQFTSEQYQLPLLYAVKDSGLFDKGDGLLASLEEAYLYLFDHESRLAFLSLNLEDLAGLAAEPTPESESFVSNFFDNLFSKLRTWFADAANGITEIIANTFRAKDKLCINDTCVNEEQLKALLNGQASSGSSSSDSSPTTQNDMTGEVAGESTEATNDDNNNNDSTSTETEPETAPEPEVTENTAESAASDSDASVGAGGANNE